MEKKETKNARSFRQTMCDVRQCVCWVFVVDGFSCAILIRNACRGLCLFDGSAAEADDGGGGGGLSCCCRWHYFSSAETATTKRREEERNERRFCSSSFMCVCVCVRLRMRKNVRLLKRIYRYSVNTLLESCRRHHGHGRQRRRCFFFYFYFSSLLFTHSLAWFTQQFTYADVADMRTHKTHKRIPRRSRPKHGKSACEIRRIIIIIVNYTVFE